MAGTADLIANTWALPQPAPSQLPRGRGYAEEAPYDDGLKALEGIQSVNNVTSDYYKKVAQLKSFMGDVHKNLGIDVRVPDASNPESIQLNELYHNALADIMAQGNLLKNSHAVHNQLINEKAVYAKGVDPNATPAEQLVNGRDYQVGLDPLVKEQNDFNQQPHDSTNIKLAQKKYDDTIKYLESTKDGTNNSLVDHNIAALVPPRSVKDRQFATPYQYHKGLQAENNAANMLKYAANLKAGLVDFKPTTLTAPSGELYEANTNYAGENYGRGGQKISKILQDPKTGKQTIVFDGGKSIPMPDNPTDFVSALAEGQNKGFNSSDLQSYIEKNGLEGDMGKVNSDPLLPDANTQAKIRQQQKASRITKAQFVDPIKKAIIDRAVAMVPNKPSWWGTTSETIPLGEGKNIQLGIHKNGNYSIENIEEIFPRSMFMGANKKPDPLKYKEFSKLVTEKPLGAIVKILMTKLPIEDYKPIFESLGLPIPGEVQNQPEQPVGTPVAPQIDADQPLQINGKTVTINQMKKAGYSDAQIQQVIQASASN